MSGIDNNQPIRAQSSREERAKAQKEARDLRAASRASQREIPQPSQMTRVDDSVPRDMGESQRVEHEDHTQELEISPIVGISENSFYRNNTDNINIGYKGIFSYKDSQSIHST